MSSDQTQKELLNFIRGLQKQVIQIKNGSSSFSLLFEKDSQELVSMKNFLHDKFTEDYATIAKEREKSKALFLEVVRLGENQEKNTEFLQNLNMQYEGRLKAIESRFSIGERSLNGLMVKNDQGINSVSEWNEKLEKRIQNLESNLLTIGVYLKIQNFWTFSVFSGSK